MNTINWDAYARAYDALNALTPYQELYAAVIACMHNNQSHMILDAGCGTGNLLQYCHQHHLCGADITCVDFSADMLAQAHTKMYCNNASFAKTDLNHTLPFAEETFDTVVSVNVLYALNDPRKSLTEFARVLKKGGLLICVTPLADSRSELILRAHCKDPRGKDFWLMPRSPEEVRTLLHTVIPDHVVAEKLCAVAYHDHLLRENPQHHFLTRNQLHDFAQQTGLLHTISTMPTYANQNCMLTAYKGVSHAHH